MFRPKRFREMYGRLQSKVREAKRAFKAVVIHLNEHKTTLSPEDRAALKHLTVFWRGDPMRHTQQAFYDIKPHHRLNGRKGPVKPLWDAYIEPLMDARCLMMGMAHEFPEVC